MKTIVNNKKMIIFFLLIMTLTTSLYFAYKKISYKKPMTAKLVMKQSAESWE